MPAMAKPGNAAARVVAVAVMAGMVEEATGSCLEARRAVLPSTWRATLQSCLLVRLGGGLWRLARHKPKHELYNQDGAWRLCGGRGSGVRCRDRAARIHRDGL